MTFKKIKCKKFFLLSLFVIVLFFKLSIILPIGNQILIDSVALYLIVFIFIYYLNKKFYLLAMNPIIIIDLKITTPKKILLKSMFIALLFVNSIYVSHTWDIHHIFISGIILIRGVGSIIFLYLIVDLSFFILCWEQNLVKQISVFFILIIFFYIDYIFAFLFSLICLKERILKFLFIFFNNIKPKIIYWRKLQKRTYFNQLKHIF